MVNREWLIVNCRSDSGDPASLVSGINGMNCKRRESRKRDESGIGDLSSRRLEEWKSGIVNRGSIALSP